MADLAKRSRDTPACPQPSLNSIVSVDKFYFDSDSFKYSDELEGLRWFGTITWIFKESDMCKVLWDDGKTTNERISNVQLEKDMSLAMPKYSNELYNLYYNGDKIFRGKLCLSNSLLTTKTLKDDEKRYVITDIVGPQHWPKFDEERHDIDTFVSWPNKYALKDGEQEHQLKHKKQIITNTSNKRTAHKRVINYTEVNSSDDDTNNVTKSKGKKCGKKTKKISKKTENLAIHTNSSNEEFEISSNDYSDERDNELNNQAVKQTTKMRKRKRRR